MDKTNKARLTFRFNDTKKPPKPIIQEAEVIETVDSWNPPQKGSLALIEHSIEESKPKPVRMKVLEEDRSKEDRSKEDTYHRGEDFHRTRARSRQLLDEWMHEEKDLSDVTSSLYSPYFQRSQGPIIIEEDSNRSRSSYKYRRIPFFRYFSSIGGAVITGFLMGLVLLSFFAQEDGISKFYAPLMGGTKTEQSDTQAPSTLKDSPSETSDFNGVAVELPSQPYFMVQAGVFGEESGANLLIDQLKIQGYEAMLLPTSTDFRVYIGTAGTKEDASLVASYFKGQNIEVYVKDFAIPSVNSLKLASSEADPAPIVTFLQEGEKLYQQLSHLHSGAINGTTSQSTTLAGDLSRWMNSVGQFRQALPTNSQIQVEQMLIHMKEAVALQLSYETDPSIDKVWRSQARLMKYVVTTQQWVQGLAGTPQSQ
jgi:hypothetical protein